MSDLPVLVRRVSDVEVGPEYVELAVDGFAGVHLDGAPGWLTGEDPLALGVELSMPNLPDLHPPAASPHPHRVRIDVLGPQLLRIRSAPPADGDRDRPEATYCSFPDAGDRGSGADRDHRR
ncbi:hypothetical protein MLP_21550 [Microlunatus phosphovorus NM-1]|uniref:Uncharacterized protein n=1 Tax=Microlunatus phosphovorus (strain ATCC 700054 / DSM 10555 / JCM 9379 / NBRC 101784 / NCIMB 13414 / VKM Ac-1990 / NM-1) TaxID=1032480 RepID=F5XDZ6_MICPN|nr:hypothetical protein [Microlunatus phosphovorus]BAK35169.1 hypothetical protein MLP_21550 [Microlunatus phosphovorus NM-1]